MFFRKASIADRPRVLEICKTIWDGYDYIPNIFEKWLNDSTGEFTMILENEEIIGMAKFTISEPGVGWLEGLRVAPEARSKGYAKEITRYYLAKGQELGLPLLRLSVYFENCPSIHVTESNGFKRVAYFGISEKWFDKEVETPLITELKPFQATLDSPDIDMVIQRFLNSPEYTSQGNFLGYGWLFRKLSEWQLKNDIALGNVYYLKEENEITGGIIVYPDDYKNFLYYVVMVTGSDIVISNLLKWAHYQALKANLKGWSSMIPADNRLKELFAANGLSQWDDTTEPNVYIYELCLKEEE